MSNAVDFDAVPALNLTAEKQKIDFPVERETQFSQGHRFVSGYNRISVPDPEKAGAFMPIGEVPVTRPHLPYGETMDWMVNEFEDVGVPFKLRTSVLNKKDFSLYQEYIFDQEVAPPDGEKIAPMVLVKASYTKGSPLAIHLGTYRFICSNGAIVSAGGKTCISVNSRNWGDLSTRGFKDEFRNALDHYQDVSNFYAKLSSVPFTDTMQEIFTPKLVPFCIRKKVIGNMEEEGLINLNLDTDKLQGEKYKVLKEEDFNDPNLIHVYGNLSTWDVYNKFTYTGSRLNSSNRVLIAAKSIDRVFRRLKAVA